MRVCIVYDCLFPWTIGGAERWYRNLAERLAADGHDVTYLTRLQWEPASAPQIPGVRVIAVSGTDELYGPDGTRRFGPPLRFGRGVLGHLWRHGRDYDVVHTASFPYFSLLAAGVARRRGGYRLLADWHEVWTGEYWRSYVGGLAGTVGLLVQRACARVDHVAFCFSRLHAGRLVAAGYAGEPIVLEGEYAGDLTPPVARSAAVPALVVVAGRQIAEKRVPAAVAGIAAARARGADVRAVIFGDGPEHALVRAEIERLGLADVIETPGFVDAAVIDEALRGALCLLHPSSREGYGMVVVEASAAGTPSIVVADADNAAVELVDEDVNGVIAPSATAEDLADALLAIHAGGDALRASTCAWFAANATRLSLGASLDVVAARYAE